MGVACAGRQGASRLRHGRARVDCGVDDPMNGHGRFLPPLLQRPKRRTGPALIRYASGMHIENGNANGADEAVGKDLVEVHRQDHRRT